MSMPHDDLAPERALLGAYLITPATLDDPDAAVGVADLRDETHRRILAAVRKLHADGTPADAVTVTDALPDHTRAAELAVELLEATPHAGHARHYAAIVRRQADRRRYLDLLRGETERAADPEADPDELRREFVAAAENLGGTAKRQATRSAADVLRTWNPLDLTPPARIDCGLPIDLRPGRIWMLAAPPALGKTALVGQMTFDALRNDPGLQAVVCNVEVLPEELLTRETARMSGVSATSILNRDYRDGDRSRICYALDSIREIADRLHFVDWHEIESIDRTAQRYDAGLVVLDYIQRIRPRGEFGSRVDALDSLMGDVRRLASDGRCLIAVSSLTRSRSPGKGGHEQGMGGLRGSGELEYGGDAIYTITADEIGSGITLVCHKNRFGPRRDIRLTYHRPTQAFAPEFDDDPSFPGDAG